MHCNGRFNDKARQFIVRHPFRFSVPSVVNQAHIILNPPMSNRCS
jgi:hypothetical protein